MMKIVCNEAKSPLKQNLKIKEKLEFKQKQLLTKLQNLSNKFQMEVIHNVEKKESKHVQDLDM